MLKQQYVFANPKQAKKLSVRFGFDTEVSRKLFDLKEEFCLQKGITIKTDYLMRVVDLAMIGEEGPVF